MSTTGEVQQIKKMIKSALDLKTGGELHVNVKTAAVKSCLCWKNKVNAPDSVFMGCCAIRVWTLPL